MAQKNNTNAKKEVTRDYSLQIPISKQEKDLWDDYAKNTGINKTRLARNILMIEAESYYNKYVERPIFKAYIKYLEITKNTEALERIKKE